MSSRIAMAFRRPRLSMIVLASVGVVAGSVAAVSARQPGKVTIEVYKTPTCGCCSKWVDHLKANGFTVKTTDLGDLDAVKKRHGVPTDLGSCHTALADGYVIEGHVPASDVARMLKERPKIAGVAVPSMPAGSPGMEVPGRKVQPYRVIAFDKAGKAWVYATYGGASPR